MKDKHKSLTCILLEENKGAKLLNTDLEQQFFECVTKNEATKGTTTIKTSEIASIKFIHNERNTQQN